MTLPMVQSQPWYAEGLRFKCTGCGQCCTGGPGYVWLTPEEALAIAEHLNISIEEFGMKYLRKINGRLSLKEDSETYDCVFLKNNKCSIYSHRPKQCRTFPWWLSNLRSKKAWKEAARTCEGMNHPEGELFTPGTIESERDDDS